MTREQNKMSWYIEYTQRYCVNFINFMSIKLFTCHILLLTVMLPAVVIGQHQQESYQQDFQAGLDLFEKGLFAEAIPHFEDAVNSEGSATVKETASFYKVRAMSKIDSVGTDQHVDQFLHNYPNSNRSAILLREVAEQHRERDELADAIRRMDQALNYPQSSRNRAELTYILGETAAEHGDFDLARSYFLQVSDENRRSEWSPKALYARGRLYLEEEEYSESAEAFELLRERHPINEMTRRIGTALGESYFQQRRYEEAIEAFDDALVHLDGENRSKAVYLMAESYNALNNFPEATRYYRQYINRSEDGSQARIAHYGLGWVYHKQDIFHWAARAFGEAAIGDDEIARKALYYKAVNEKLGGRYDQAINTFREFGSRFDEGVFSEEARFEWAVTAFEIGFYSESIEVLLPLARRYEELNNPGLVLTFLGEAYYANNEYTRSIETFELAEQLADVDPALIRQARFQRAWVMYSNQAYEQAQPGFQQVYNEAPNTDLGTEALFWSADSYYQTRNFGPASQQFSSFINNYPNHELVGAAKYSLGWSYFMMGDFENATGPLIDFLENYEPPSIALYPYDTDTKLRIGDAYYAQGNYREAMNYYNSTIGAEPGGDYAMFQVANSHYRMNRNFEAVTQFRRMLRIYPYSRLREQAQYNVAYIYLNTGNYDQAVEEFQSVISRYPGTEWAARAQYNIGDSYYNAGNFERAIEEYRKVLEEYPRSEYIIEAIDGIQFAQLSAGDDDTSTDVLEDFLADNPTSTTADRLRFRQAENVLQSGNYEAAVREFQQYLRITNNQSLMPDAYYNMADAHLRTGNRQEAAEALETLINEFPNSERVSPALVDLGRVHFELGNYSESKRRYEQLLERDSRYEQEAMLGIGNANLELGNSSEARQNFERVLSINEDNDAARVGLGKVLLRDGRIEEARRFFSLVAENNTTDIGAEAQFLVGKSFADEGNRETAIEEFSRVRSLFQAYDKWVAEAQFHTAEIYIRQGRRGDATQLLNSIVENYPGTEGAEKAARLLRGN